MREIKHQVFISSTFLDLKDERQAAVQAILNSNNIPAGMELFTANNISQWEVIQRWIKSSDIYMLILGGRYGSIDNITKLSYTHMEYRYAKELGKPIFAIIISDEKLKTLEKEHPDFIEANHPELLKLFRDEVKCGLVRHYDDTKDIEIYTGRAIAEIENEYQLVGWIKGDNKISNEVTEEIARLSLENSRLKAQINSIEIRGVGLDDFKSILKGKSSDYNESIRIIKLHGKDLSVGVSGRAQSLHPGNKLYEEFKLFIELGLVTKDNIDGIKYKFSDDGHKFYIQLLKEDFVSGGE